MRVAIFVSAFTASLGIKGAALPEPDSMAFARRANSDTAPSWTDDTEFWTSLLDRHNQFRTQHGAGKLSWNKTLSGFAKTYLNKKGSGQNTCPDFDHSGGPYGENIAIGYGTPTQATTAWGEERKHFDFKRPESTTETGHFTQVVWKSTKSLGCARKYCTSSNVMHGWYLVCEYWPRGNIIGQFDKQVLQQTSKRDVKNDQLEDEYLYFDGLSDYEEGDTDEDEKKQVGEPLVV